VDGVDRESGARFAQLELACVVAEDEGRKMKAVKWARFYSVTVCSGIVALSTMVVAGCTPMKNVDIDPPTSGLLHTLQKLGEQGVTDRGYDIKATAVDGRMVSGQNTPLALHVLDPSGMPVKQFTLDMTKLMHTIIISKDLSAFDHVHPNHMNDGTFLVNHTFPFGGEFLLVNEFMPDDKDVTVHKQWVNVEGDSRVDEPVEADIDLVKEIGDLKVTMSFSPDLVRLKPEQMVMINFQFADALTGEPVKMEPYLDTPGHCVIVDRRMEQYLHVHAAVEMSADSSVMFHTSFPKSGIYKLWGQFQHDGKVITVPYVIEM
jgi:hypothetical protein